MRTKFALKTKNADGTETGKEWEQKSGNNVSNSKNIYHHDFVVQWAIHLCLDIDWCTVHTPSLVHLVSNQTLDEGLVTIETFAKVWHPGNIYNNVFLSVLFFCGCCCWCCRSFVSLLSLCWCDVVFHKTILFSLSLFYLLTFKSFQ